MQNSWRKYVLRELIHVRIDAVYMSGDTNRAYADLTLPTNAAIVVPVPDILRTLDIDIAGFPLAQWQLRTAAGTILLADDTLNDAGITSGERLVIINGPGLAPKPRFFDATDAIIDTIYTDGVGTTDLIVGCTAALVATVSIAAALLSLSSTDSTLAAATSSIVLLAVAGGLRPTLLHSTKPAIVMSLELQAFVLSIASGLYFVGLDLHRIPTDWLPTVATSVALAVIGLIFLILNIDDGDNRITVTLGAASLSATATCGLYAAATVLFHNLVQPEALTTVSTVILILLAPSIATKAADTCVSKAPTAGESFDDSETPEISHDASKRVGWILDDILCDDTEGLSIFTLVVFFSGAYANRQWPLGIVAVVIVFCAIHSHDQARKVASTCIALTGFVVIVAVASQQ